MFFSLAAAGLGAAAFPLLGAAADLTDFDWATIQPSTSLNYTSCYDGLKCAKLSVPLDWLDLENEERVVLAVTARPAVVEKTDPSFGGTIIVNPGGPSGSGVGFVLRAGELIQQTADGDKKYEILSFDPRGVGFTTPNADCHHNEFARGGAALEDRALGPLDSGEDVLKRHMSRAKAFGQLCHSSTSGSDIRGFMSTASVARDMVEIVDKLDELRNGQDEVDLGDDEQARIELRSETKSDVPRIQYWGFSYGTVLGNYFASMFPGRVGRMILEAVEDPQDYANATWILNLRDTQHVYTHLWETCYQAGNRCALFQSADNSPEDIQSRFESFLAELDNVPQPYVLQGSYHAITREDVMGVIFNPLYDPQGQFPGLAVTLAEAMTGNFTSLVSALAFPKPDDSCPLQLPQTYTWSKDALVGIACGDGDSQQNMTVADFQKHVEILKTDSPHFGASWANLRLGCTGWQYRPKYRFAGPWKTPAPDANLVEGKPAAPLLFVSSLYDPVTPLYNAIEASKGHPGSKVLIQDNAGHGSLKSPGKCRENYIKQYFETGKVPEDQTMCKSDCLPFQECAKSEAFATLDVDAAVHPWGQRPPLGLL